MPELNTAANDATVAGTEKLLTLDFEHLTVAQVAAYANAARSIQTITSASTVTPVATNDKVVVSAQAAAILFDNPTGTEAEGQGFVIALKDNGTARAITWGANYRAMGAALPTTTVISKWKYIPVIYNGTDDKWDVLPASDQA